MRDRFFYPLLVLVITGILALALLPGQRHSNLEPDEVISKGYSMDSLDLQKLTASPGTVASFIDGQGDEPLLAVLSSNNPLKLAGESAGVFATLGPNYEAGFGGHDLEITLTARAGRGKPLGEFKAGYFTAGVGDSGWRDFTLSENFEDYSFTFTSKPPKGKPANDFVGIWPGDEGKSDIMELKSIRIRVLQ